ncbi:MAG: DUF11 domain-containing protein [Gemmatimonadaceae bacterium]
MHRWPVAPLEGLFVDADSVFNHGTLTLNHTTLWYMQNDGYFENTGSIVVNDIMNLFAEGPTTAKLASGSSITGTGTSVMEASTSSLHVEWSGGQLSDRTGHARTPLVTFDADTLTFGNTLLDGYVQLSGTKSQTTLIRGNIGANVHVTADLCGATYDLRRGGGAPTLLSGELTFVSGTACVQDGTVSGNGLTNNGQLAFLNFSNKVQRVQVDSLVNNQPLTIRGSLEYSSLGGLVRNTSTIAVDPNSDLSIGSGSTFLAMSGTTQSGPLTLSGVLAGTGIVGDVTSRGGLVTPGSLTGGAIGRLTMHSLDLDGTSTLAFDISGPGLAQHDGIDVTTSVDYGGTGMSLNFVSTYVGGTCGDVIPLVTDHTSGFRGGIFGKLGGFHPQPSAWWRTYLAPGEMGVAGYNPTTAVTVTASSLALSEGGAAKSYNMCVSHAPTALVTVSVADTLPGQLQLTNTPVTFGASGWELPQLVTVSAVDDAVIEPPLTDILTHTVTSNDGSFNGQLVRSIGLTIGDNDGRTDLSLAVTSNPGPIPVGSNFTVSFQVTNNGPTLSTGASFVVPAVAGFTYVSAAGVTCQIKGGVGLVCLVPGIASGSSASFSVTGNAVAAGVWSVTMQLNAQQSDPNLANNTQVKNLTVN